MVEEAGEGGLEDGVVVLGQEGDGDGGAGGVAEEGFGGVEAGGVGRVLGRGAGGVGEEEFGGGEGGEGGGDVEAVAEEEADGDEAGGARGGGDGRGVGNGVREDDGGEFGVLGGEGGGEGGAEAFAEGDDGVRGDVTGCGEVVEGGGGVLRPCGFRWVGGGVAGAEAAVVDGEDVEAGGVEAGEGGEGVGERAGAAVEIEDGVGGVAGWGCERGCGRSGGLVVDCGEAGSHQAVRRGWPVSAASKRMGSKGRLRAAGVWVTVREGWRTSCHSP